MSYKDNKSYPSGLPSQVKIWLEANGYRREELLTDARAQRELLLYVVDRYIEQNTFVGVGSSFSFDRAFSDGKAWQAREFLHLIQSLGDENHDQ